MLDDPSVLIRKAAYLEQVHDLHRMTRRASIACVASGFGLLIVALLFDMPHPVRWAAYGLLAVGWLTQIYVAVRRSRYLRSHPFDPDA